MFRKKKACPKIRRSNFFKKEKKLKKRIIIHFQLNSGKIGIKLYGVSCILLFRE